MRELIDANIQPWKRVAFPDDPILSGSRFQVVRRFEGHFEVECRSSPDNCNIGQKFDIRFDHIAAMNGNMITLSDAFYNR